MSEYYNNNKVVHNISDPIVVQVLDKIVSRHEEGMDKFGITMEDNDKPMPYWIDDTIEELIDAIHYLTKMKSLYEKNIHKDVR